MRSISVIGIGMSRSTLTAQALDAIMRADLLIGAPRMLSEFADLNKTTSVAFLAQDVVSVIRSSEAERIAVLFSGDVGFYSGAAGLLPLLDPSAVTVYPGISSAVYFFAKCGRPWQNAALVSCHGLDTDLVSPDSVCFVVVLKNGGPELFLGDAQPFLGGNELPAPG